MHGDGGTGRGSPDTGAQLVVAVPEQGHVGTAGQPLPPRGLREGLSLQNHSLASANVNFT